MVDQVNPELLRKGVEDDQRPRKMSPWMPITDPLELALLSKSGEEFNEISKVLNRIIMQGIDGIDPESGKSNLECLQDELADVMNAVSHLGEYYKRDMEAVGERAQRKYDEWKEWFSIIAVRTAR